MVLEKRRCITPSKQNEQFKLVLRLTGTPSSIYDATCDTIMVASKGSEHAFAVLTFFNPYPLKTSENLSFSNVFREV